MSYRVRLLWLALGMTLVLVPMSLGLAQEKEMAHGEPAAPVEPAMGPPEQLEKVAFFLGEWDVAVRMRVGPEAPWQESTAKAEVTRLLKGCVQRMHFTGTMMGMEFEGEETLTYNRDTKKFESFWFDSVGARASTFAGGFDGGGNLLLSGTDVMNGEAVLTRSIVIPRSEDEVEWRMEVSEDNGVTWYMSLKMVYTRS